MYSLRNTHRVGNILLRRLFMKYFLRSFFSLPVISEGQLSVSGELVKECAQYWLTA